MRKLFIVLASALFIASCGRSGKSDIVGSYDATLSQPGEVDTTNMASMMAASYLEMVRFGFVFNDDNTCESVMILENGGEAVTDTIFMTWEMKGDSIMFAEDDGFVQSYYMQPTDKGFDLTGEDAIFKLTRK